MILTFEVELSPDVLKANADLAKVRGFDFDMNQPRVKVISVVTDEYVKGRTEKGPKTGLIRPCKDEKRTVVRAVIKRNVEAYNITI